jgi:hypothetical protein
MRFPCSLLPHLKNFTRVELQLFFSFLINHKRNSQAVYPRVEKFSKKHGGSGYRIIKNAGRRIMARTAEIENGENKIHIRHFIKYFTIEKGTIKSEFDEKLIDIVEHNKTRSKYLTVKLKNIMALKSAYSIRLYLFALSLDFTEKRITINELSEYTGMKECVRTRKFLEFLRNAVKEVSIHTDIKISIEEIRVGTILKEIVINSKRSDDTPALEQLFSPAQIEYLLTTYPMEYLKSCERIVKKFHDDKKGTAAGYFLAVAKKNFHAWVKEQSAMKATMEKNIQYRLDQERKKPVTKKQVAQVMRSLKEVPEWLEKFNRKHGLTKT